MLRKIYLWLRERYEPQVLTAGDALERLASRRWQDLDRESKRVTAPYSLGWEEGYAAALRQFEARGHVPDIGMRSVLEKKARSESGTRSRAAGW